MNETSDQILIAYILDSINKIMTLCSGGNTKEHMSSNWVIHDAIMHRLQTLAESSQRLSSTVKEKLPEVPWKKIAGFRNVLVHQYLGDLDDEVLWHVITHELPLLQKALVKVR